MKIGDPAAYLDSLRVLDRNVFVLGERCECTVDHPLIRPSANAVAESYNTGEEPEAEGLLYATSHLTGKKISRFAHIHQDTGDLVDKVLMQRLLGRRTATCFQRCVGMDGFNALYSVTYECDQVHGTDYHSRLKDYIEWVQDENIVVEGAMTDVKGDRSLRPGQQADPDMFVHVVDRTPEGIVVRGARRRTRPALSTRTRYW